MATRLGDDNCSRLAGYAYQPKYIMWLNQRCTDFLLLTINVRFWG